MGRVAAIIPAAGQGKRMGSRLNKQYLCLAGLPVLLHTLKIFELCDRIEEIIVVAGSGEVEYCQQEIVDKYALTKVAQVVEGGAERQNSVFNGLKALSDDVEYVLIHDGARPLLTQEKLFTALEALKQHEAVVVGVPVKDTIKVVDQQGVCVQTPPRNSLWAVQTPQLFRRELIMQAYAWAEAQGFVGTDDASLVEGYGGRVQMVMGSYENLKITTPEDLEIAENILRRRGICVSE